MTTLNKQKLTNNINENRKQKKFMIFDYNNKPKTKNPFKYNSESTLCNPNNSSYLKNILNKNENETEADKKELFLDNFTNYVYRNLFLNTPLVFSQKKINAGTNTTNDINENKYNTHRSSKVNINNNSQILNKIKKNTFNKYSRNNHNSHNNANSFFSNQNTNHSIKDKKSILKNIFPLKANNITSIKENKIANKMELNKMHVITSYDNKKYNNKNKYINHPYYSPSVISKREKYKIFNSNESPSFKKEKKKTMNDFRIFSFSDRNLNQSIEKNNYIKVVKYNQIL